jgi:hypothetical protein
VTEPSGIPEGGIGPAGGKGIRTWNTPEIGEVAWSVVGGVLVWCSMLEVPGTGAHFSPRTPDFRTKDEAWGALDPSS